MRLRILHTTRYAYAGPVAESHNEARLMPLSDEDQTCLDFRLETRPVAQISAYDLPSGRVHNFNIREPHTELLVHSESLVVTFHKDPFANLQLLEDDSAFYAHTEIRERYAEFLAPTDRVPLHPETDRIAAVARKQARLSTASFLIMLTRMMHRAFTYAPGETNVNSSILDVLEKQRGVCQDFAHLMLAVCRRQGIPARYISGYLFTGERRIHPTSRHESDATPDEGDEGTEGSTEGIGSNGLVSGDAMHAWIECLLPDGHWHGFDPTNNLLTNDFYVKAHWGRDYGDVTPLRGVYRGPAQHTLDVAVRVIADER